MVHTSGIFHSPLRLSKNAFPRFRYLKFLYCSFFSMRIVCAVVHTQMSSFKQFIVKYLPTDPTP